jgi:DNA-binding NtrC family response regulator
MAQALVSSHAPPSEVHPGARPPLELEGGSPAASRLQELVRRAAARDAPILLVVERGSDVEGLAADLHARRAPHGPLVTVACGDADAVRLDRQLFGSFAAPAPEDLEPASRDSALIRARGGTLCLLEVTELPAALQSRLARALRDGEVRLEGEPVPLTSKVLATAAPAIDADVRDQRFRADLYRRLSASRIDLPSLGQRPEDVPTIAVRLLADVCAAQGRPARAFTQAALALLGAVSWPGNAAELRDVIERVVASCASDPLQVEHLLPAMRLDRPRASFEPCGSLRDARLKFEREYIASVLQHHGWRMSDAAQTLGIHRPNLYRKARQLGIPLAKAPDRS